MRALPGRMNWRLRMADTFWQRCRTKEAWGKSRVCSPAFSPWWWVDCPVPVATAVEGTTALMATNTLFGSPKQTKDKGLSSTPLGRPRHHEQIQVTLEIRCPLLVIHYKPSNKYPFTRQCIHSIGSIRLENADKHRIRNRWKLVWQFQATFASAACSFHFLGSGWEGCEERVEIVKALDLLQAPRASAPAHFESQPKLSPFLGLKGRCPGTQVSSKSGRPCSPASVGNTSTHRCVGVAAWRQI